MLARLISVFSYYVVIMLEREKGEVEDGREGKGGIGTEKFALFKDNMLYVMCYRMLPF